MDIIAEDCTEELSTPTETTPPTDIRSNIADNMKKPPSPRGAIIGGESVDEPRRRRTGASVLQSSQVSAVFEAELQNEKPPAKNGLHQLLTNPPPVKIVPNTQPQALIGMLSNPIYPVISSDYSYSMVTDTMTNIMSSAPQPPPQNIMDVSMLLQMQHTANRNNLSHVSTILSNVGIRHQVHPNNVIMANHQGVSFKIHVANNIQLQYLSGDTSHFQSLHSELMSRLVSTAQ